MGFICIVTALSQEPLVTSHETCLCWPIPRR